MRGIPAWSRRQRERPTGRSSSWSNSNSLNQTRQFSFIKGGDGRIRAISNRNVANNEYTIKDGKFTSNGNAPPWQTRCR